MTWRVGEVGDVALDQTPADAVRECLAVVSVLMLVVSEIAWAIASSSGNYQAATRARSGLWVAIGAAALAGRE